MIDFAIAPQSQEIAPWPSCCLVKTVVPVVNGRVRETIITPERLQEIRGNNNIAYNQEIINASIVTATVTELRADAIATDMTAESGSQAISARPVTASTSVPYKSDHETGEPPF